MKNAFSLLHGMIRHSSPRPLAVFLPELRFPIDKKKYRTIFFWVNKK